MRSSLTASGCLNLQGKHFWRIQVLSGVQSLVVLQWWLSSENVYQNTENYGEVLEQSLEKWVKIYKKHEKLWPREFYLSANQSLNYFYYCEN